LPSSFGQSFFAKEGEKGLARDRATRLRSSDAQKPKGNGILDAKAFDVVPACNTGERATVTMRT